MKKIAYFELGTWYLALGTWLRTGISGAGLSSTAVASSACGLGHGWPDTARPWMVESR
jgi:hypothetical protein